MKYISEERLIELLKEIPDYDNRCDTDTAYWIKDSLLSSLINECLELNQLNDPELKECIEYEAALAHDAGFIEGYNKGFSDGENCRDY